jgi:hypothetical protein
MSVLARPLADWSQEDGPVLWWFYPMTEAPYIGSPLDLGRTIEVHDHSGLLSRFWTGGWPGYHTHWTPLPEVPAFPFSGPLERWEMRAKAQLVVTSRGIKAWGTIFPSK